MVSILMFKKHKAVSVTSAAAVGILSVWLIGELLILNLPAAPTKTEAVFLAIGVIMLVLGLVQGD